MYDVSGTFFIKNKKYVNYVMSIRIAMAGGRLARLEQITSVLCSMDFRREEKDRPYLSLVGQRDFEIARSRQRTRSRAKSLIVAFW